jgi:type VI protein secretion system component VasF
MKLSLLFEPVLNYIAFLRSDVETMAKAELSEVKKEVLNLITDIENKVKMAGMDVSSLYNKMELPLIFFIDYMIATSNLPIAEEWDKNRLASSKSIITGDKKFFDIFEEIYSKHDPQYDECLDMFYLFLVLGFKGYYENNPEMIENIMHRISNRVPEIQLKQTSHVICKKNYERTCTDSFVYKVFLPIRTILWPLLVLLLIAFGINFVIFYKTSLPLLSELKGIEENTQYEESRELAEE